MIKLSGLIDLKPITEAEVFTATSKETGTTSVFKSKASRDAAIKAGTHEKRKDDKDGGVKDPTDKPKVNIFNKDKKEPKSSTPKLDKDGDGGMSSDTTRSVEDYLNKKLGLDGSADLNSGGAIEYNIPGSTDTLLIGNDEKDGKAFSVGLANEDGFDPDDTYKSFDNQEDAMAYAKELGQKLKGGKDTNESSTKLGRLLPEGLINEGTRSQVGIIDRSGKIASAYVHYDGYPSNMKPGLKKHMKNEKDVLKLIKSGGARGIYDDKEIEYYKSGKPTKGNLKDFEKYVDAADRNGMAEYVYLYNMKDKKWYFADVYGDKKLKKLF